MIAELKTQLQQLSQRRAQLTQQAVLAEAQREQIRAELNYVTGQCVLLQDLIPKLESVTPTVTPGPSVNGSALSVPRMTLEEITSRGEGDRP